MPSMKRKNTAWASIVSVGVISFVTAIIAPPSSMATPFVSPTPPTNSTINQPFVTFQRTGISHRLFRMNDNVPVFWIIAILVLLLVLTTIYLHSSRPRH